MSTDTTWQIKSTSIEATLSVAEKIGKNLRGGEVIELRSDVGGGKTTFTKGLARGFGYEGVVSSPTFTISQIYKNSVGLSLLHFDFYRLSEAGIMADELAESIEDSSISIVVEWADVVHGVLPVDRLVIDIIPTSETTRELHLSCGKNHVHLLEGVL